MAKINSKKKGNTAEREIVKILNNFYDTNEFKRVPTSGMFGNIHSSSLSENEAKIFTGDIITPSFFKYSIEVKHYKDIDLWKMFSTGKTQWDEQLKEEKENLKKSKKKGIILIFKKNRSEWMAMIEKKDFKPIKYFPKIELQERIIVNLKDLLNNSLSR